MAKLCVGHRFPAKLSETSTNQGSNFASSISVKWDCPFSKVEDRHSTKSVDTDTATNENGSPLNERPSFCPKVPSGFPSSSGSLC